jgi:hypothetical protein
MIKIVLAHQTNNGETFHKVCITVNTVEEAKEETAKWHNNHSKAVSHMTKMRYLNNVPGVDCALEPKIIMAPSNWMRILEEMVVSLS